MPLGKQQRIIACILLTCLWHSPAVRLQQQGSLATMEGEESTKSSGCWFSGANELKKYYFEFKFDPDSDDHTAMEFVRDPQRPKLFVHQTTQWVVRTPPKNKSLDENADLPWIPDVESPEDMEWLPACMKAEGQDGCDPREVQEIDLINVSYFKKTLIPVTDPSTGEVKEGEEEVGIEIMYEDGTKDNFEGGVYLPRNLMLPAMKRAEENYGKFSGLGQEARDEASEADNMFWAGVYTFRNTVTGAIGTTMGGGAVAGTSVGVGVGAVALLLSIPGLSGVVVGTMLLGAGSGLIAGSAAGLALGAVLGTVAGGSMALWDYHKQKKELGLSATYKIWSKMKCHDLFTRCGNIGDDKIIVPTGKECPSEPAA